MIELPLIMLFIMTVPLQVSDIVEDELEGIIDMAVDKIEIPTNNPLNVTQGEADELKESSKSLLLALFTLLSTTHTVAEDTVEVVSPIELDGFTLFLIGLGITGVFVISVVKKIGLHLLYMIIIGVVLVVIFVILDINQGDFSSWDVGL